MPAESTRSSSSVHCKAYVRPAHLSEREVVVRVLTRAFATDPLMNWFGGVTEPVTDIDAPTPAAERSMRNLAQLQDALVRAVWLMNGVVAIAVAPQSKADTTGVEQKDAEGEEMAAGIEGAKEEVVGVALWLPPGQTLDMSLLTFLRAGIVWVLFGLGPFGVKRMMVDYQPVLESALERAFRARGLDWRGSWYLLEMVVDPVHQGKGYATILMEDGFRRASPEPVHLEATTAFSRDIYLHYGFEIDEEHQFGVGTVDTSGVRAKGEAATGLPEWIMTKWTV